MKKSGSRDVNKAICNPVHQHTCTCSIQKAPSHPTNKNHIIFEPVHEISNNVVCATSKGPDQPAHTRSLIRAFASRLSIL